VFCAQFQRQYAVSVNVAAGAGTASVRPEPADGYLPDRQPFTVDATPATGSRFVRWTGTTFLTAAGTSVSNPAAKVWVSGSTSNYQANFTNGPLHVVDSRPRGALVLVDGGSYYTPVSFAWAAGTSHTITFNSPQMQGNNTRRLLFREWEDGSTGLRQVTASAEGSTYTATFQDQYLLTTSVVGSGTITTSPASDDGFYDANSTVTVTATPATGQTLRYWLVDAAGNTPVQSVVMDRSRLVRANFGSRFPWLLYHAGSFSLNPSPGTTGMIAAPGEIVSIFGPDIGPETAQSGRTGADGRLLTSIGGVSVTFDEFAAPIIYAARNQINVVVPYGLAGRPTTVVTVRGASGNQSIAMTVLETMPGLFTATGTGRGPVAALNQDGSINSETNPAAPGSVVVLYGSGAGVLKKSFPDGQILGGELVEPAAPVFVRFDKLPGQVIYAGTAPTLVNGAMQVNVIVPNEAPAGEVPVQLLAGRYASPSGTTIWLK
jgi:uncharacterized protein (TIGR03437 family)